MSLTTKYRNVGKKLAKAAIAKGYSVSVNDGEEWVVRRSKDLAEIGKALCSTDEDYLRVYNADGESLGTIMLVYGNEVCETVADYSANDDIEAIVKAAGF